MINPVHKFRLGGKARDGYRREYVGKIRYSAYWDKFSLIVNVDGIWVTELDSFGETNNGLGHKVRTHCTALEKNDAIMTVEEFFKLSQELIGWKSRNW